MSGDREAELSFLVLRAYGIIKNAYPNAPEGSIAGDWLRDAGVTEEPAREPEQLGFNFNRFGTPGCASACPTFTVVTTEACTCGTVKCGRCQ